MIWLFVLAGLLLVLPLLSLILRTMNVLKPSPSRYYDFGVIFEGTNPWAVGLYIAIIALLTFIIFFFYGIPLPDLAA